jgi:hypothetical protein
LRSFEPILALVDPATRERIANDPALNQGSLPLPVHMGLLVIGLVVCILCGVALLQRRRWARVLFVCLSAAMLGYGLTTVGHLAMIAPVALIVALLIWILFRPAATAWFGAGEGTRR